MDKSIEKKYLDKLIEHYILTEQESFELMTHLLTEDFDRNIAASILSIIAFKGSTVEELSGFAKGLIEIMKKFNSSCDDVIDIVGTGGDNKNTFNISTVSALLISTLGVKVAKEINTCVSSKCGSADLLKGLGINLEATFEQKKECLEVENFVFIHVPEYLTSLRAIKDVEYHLGISSIVSLLPPLCHPAKVKRIIIGVRDRFKASLVSQALEVLGIEKAYVLWNDEGYDELVPIGTTHLIVVEKDQKKRELALTANDFGLAGNYKSGTLIPGGEVSVNMSVISEIDKAVPGIALDSIIMNTALALRLVNRVSSLKEGADLVKSTIKEGNLTKKIQRISKISNSI